MKAEMDRISSGKRMDMMDMRRYEMPGPPPGRLTDLSAWTDSLANSHSQLQHQQNRITNLNLMHNYGTEAWKVANTHMSNLLTAALKDLTQVRKQVQEVNWQRKSAQTSAGEKMEKLSETWSLLVSKNYDIESACLQVELMIHKLEQEVALLSSQMNVENDVNHVNQQPVTSNGMTAVAAESTS